MNVSTCGKDFTVSEEEILLSQNELQLSDYFPPLRSLELLSPETKYINSYTYELLNLVFH